MYLSHALRLRAPTCSGLPYIPRGAIAHWEERSLPPAPGADMPGTPDPRGAIAIWVLFRTCPLPLRTGVWSSEYTVQHSDVCVLYGLRCSSPSRPSGCLTEKIGFPGRARSKPVCVVFCVVWLIYVLSGSYLYFSQSAAGTVRSPVAVQFAVQFKN